jgi:regulator of sigma E protease
MPVVQSLITIVLFIVLLGVLVIVHELGHFLTARAANVRVLEFGIGFPPRAKVLRSKGETLYTLNWLPIGGFVKLEGEDGEGQGDPRSFSSQNLVTRLWILVAGVLMNVILAFVIFAGIAWLASPYAGVKIGSIVPDSPAEAAGLQAGESIYMVDGKRYQFMLGESVIPDLAARPGETVTLTVIGTDGTRREVEATLNDAAAIAANQRRDDLGWQQLGALGIKASPEGFELYWSGEYAQNDPATAVSIGWRHLTGALGLIVGGLGTLVTSIASNPAQPPPVAGPVGIATQLGDIFWGAGPILTLYVAAILSANLAVVNILPFPPLDGGRMLMITLKSLFGARISLRAEQLTYMVGFVFLFAFLIWVTGFDIIRQLGGGT